MCREGWVRKGAWAGLYKKADLVSMQRSSEDALFACFLIRNGPARFGGEPTPLLLTFHGKDGRWRCSPLGRLRGIVNVGTMPPEQIGRRTITQSMIAMRFGSGDWKARMDRQFALTNAQADAFARLAGPPYNQSQYEVAAVAKELNAYRKKASAFLDNFEKEVRGEKKPKSASTKASSKEAEQLTDPVVLSRPGEKSAAESEKPTTTGRAGEISGVLLGHDGQPVPRATVVLCDQATGIPVSKQTFRPFIEGSRPDLKGLAVVTTDAQGTFRLQDVPEGRYRLIAQSWLGRQAVLDVFLKNGREIMLRGVANGIRVPSTAAKSIVIKPLGNCVVSLDEDFPNSDALLLVSTEPLSADPVLGFASWRGPFLQHLIGANRMLDGVTKIAGLPEGEIHLSVFGNDNNGGIGAGSVLAKSDKVVQVPYIPIVCGWSNGQHDPPASLQPTFMELKQIAAKKKDFGPAFLDRLLAAKGIVVDHSEKTRDPRSPYWAHMDQVVTLPSGREVRLADVLASVGYLDLQMQMRKRSGRH